MEIKQEFFESIKDCRKSFYSPPAKKVRLYFENLKGKERREYMAEQNLTVYLAEDKELENIAENISYKELADKPKEEQKKIFLKIRELYGSDRQIAKKLGCVSSTIFDFRQRLDIPAF